MLADQRLRTVFQPLVDLDSGAVVGYEALTRGPAGTALETPDRLFAAARRHRRLKDLDVACRTTALRTASEAGLTRPFTLFVNAEPEALDGWRPAAEHEALGFNIVVEPDRARADRPPGAGCCRPWRGCASSAGASRWTTSAPTPRRWRCCRWCARTS
ncbi:hypothetical protein GCM10025868_41140 [Angustibacter aerolatus]|uniref:EAL domain-containing protein n=1 Tax=Angustibacter aerolatus TaxID=1162965 RepID=A0ABQ6JP01_9ACTN|nr:EAL domain-containing protein [Angustibacter aerolatus]GMA88864.1 hypothetical protein GCM10025868_41140 [Angustibacter aerolatus]